MSSDDALRFFDPQLGMYDRAVDLVRILLDEDYECEPLCIAPAADAALYQRLAYHRLVPQLRAAVGAGRIIPSSPRLHDELARASMRQVVRGLQLESMLLDVGAQFDESGIEFRVLKGTATGHLDHPQAGLRQSADVDLLIRGDAAFDRAGRILAMSGFVAPDLEVRLMDKGETWRLSEQCSIDLHRRLHTASRELPAWAWSRWESFVIAGREFRALDRGGRMAHAASHYAISYPNHRILSSLLDLCTLARTSNSEEKYDASRLLADLGVGDIVRRITERAAVLCATDAIVIGTRGRHPLDYALRRAYDRPDLDKMALKIAKTLGMPPRDQLRVVRNWVAPSDEFLSKGGYTSRWDRAAKVTRRRWSRS